MEKETSGKEEKETDMINAFIEALVYISLSSKIMVKRFMICQINSMMRNQNVRNQALTILPSSFKEKFEMASGNHSIKYAPTKAGTWIRKLKAATHRGPYKTDIENEL